MSNQTNPVEEDDCEFFNMDFSQRYPQGWSEENWEKELEQHPMFMTKQPENGELPPALEALQQLKYGEEDNTKEELTEKYKEDGNVNFKAKKYRIAVDCYTTAIKQKAASKELNSILHANRAAANFYLQNYRSALLDALRAIELNMKNVKAVDRVIQCLNKLEKYDELIRFCDNNSDYIRNVDAIREEAADKLKFKQRDERKAKLKERKEKDANIAYENRVIDELSKRGIKFNRDGLFKVVHPAAASSRIVFDEDGSMCFPVLFVYPEIAVCDFIEKFKETDQFYQHLITMLDDENNQPAWNACTQPPEVKDEVGIHTKSKVEITLGDCLACSGCITSAETILIQQQSDKQLYQIIQDNQTLPEENQKIIVVSLSFQAIASIAAKYDLEFQETTEKLVTYFRSIGVHYVFDISFARHLSLYESQREFIDRFREDRKLCLLSSICPGFVCYAEKTQGELLTPLLSTVKSPQQMFGTLLKQIWSTNEHIRTDQIFHVSLMPCFDKKLEASRKEFIIEKEQHEVDCVLTPIELENMLIKDNCVLAELQTTRLDNFLSKFDALQELSKKFDSNQIKSHLGSGSGGYAENIYRMISATVFGQKFEKDTELKFEMRRNKDYMELDLKIDDKVVLRTALINGFRNIQTLIQRIKRGICKYNYVEVMACPSGCLNGGGLLRDVSIELVQKIYSNLSKRTLDELETDFVYLYELWFDTDAKIQKYLHTTFNIIPKSKSSINIAW